MFAPVTYIPGFLSAQEATDAFTTLWTQLDWERRVTRTRDADGTERENKVPRREYWWNSLARPYTYGRGVGIRTYYPRDPHPWIDRVSDRLTERNHVSEPYEGCFLNGYENERDALGWHADDDPGIDHSRPIAIVTLYSEPKATPRIIQFRPIGGGEIETLALEHGSLALMSAGMQATHFHRIPKASFKALPRISLTYRGLTA